MLKSMNEALQELIAIAGRHAKGRRTKTAIPRVTIGPTLDPHNVSDAIDVLSQRNGFHISDIGISEIPYRRIAE